MMKYYLNIGPGHWYHNKGRYVIHQTYKTACLKPGGIVIHDVA
jgi:hypothetical protein